MLCTLFSLRKKLWQSSILISFFFCCCITKSFAADISLKPLTKVPRLGVPLSIGIYVEKNTASINAISLDVRFDQKKVSAQSISKKDTLIQMWSENPRFSNAGGVAHVEGVILNPGFSGSSGLLATVIFTPKEEGTTTFSVDDAHVYANDGNATDIISRSVSTSVTIGPLVRSDLKEIRTEENVATSSQPAKLISGPVDADQRVSLDEMAQVVTSSTTTKVMQSIVIEDSYDKPKYTKYTLSLNKGEKINVDASILGKTLVLLPKAHLRENSLEIIAYDAYGGMTTVDLPFYVEPLPVPTLISSTRRVFVGDSAQFSFKTVPRGSVRITAKNNSSLFIADKESDSNGFVTVSLPLPLVGIYTMTAKVYKDGGESDELMLGNTKASPTVKWFFSSQNPSLGMFIMISSLVVLVIILFSLVLIRRYRNMVTKANEFLFSTLGKRAEEDLEKISTS